jgi:hypothetical protein
MGLFDIFGGGSALEKAQRQKSKLTQKFGDPTTRQKALQTVIALKSADTLPVLMQRFTFNVDPQTTDRAEKEDVFDAICALKDAAIAPVVEFLKSSEQASSWAVKILTQLLEPQALVSTLCDELRRLGTAYTRDPEKKQVLLHELETLVEKHRDARIAEMSILFLSDMSDDVKIAALKTLTASKDTAAQEAIVTLLMAEDTGRRVQVSCFEALSLLQVSIGQAEKLRPLLPEQFSINKAGVVVAKSAGAV